MDKNHLPLFKTIKEACQFTFKSTSVLAKILLVPFLLSLVWWGVSWWVIQDPTAWESTPLPELTTRYLIYITLLDLIFWTFTLSLWVPTWMAYCVDSRTPIRRIQWGRTQFTFFKYALVISSLPLGIMVLPALLMPTALIAVEAITTMNTFKILLYAGGIIVLNVFYLWAIIRIMTRVLYIEPGIALSEPTGFRRSWHQTKSSYTQLRNTYLIYAMVLVLWSIIWRFVLNMGRPTDNMLADAQFKHMTEASGHFFFLLVSPIFYGVVMRFYQHDVLWAARTK